MTTPPDAKKDPATFKLGDNPNEYADDAAKPDALEVLRTIAPQMRRDSRLAATRLGDPTAFGPLDAYAHDVDAAIAAWEKERAELGKRHREERDHYRSQMFALRAAVENVRDEFRAIIASEFCIIADDEFNAWDDALDAALKGNP